MIRLKRTPASLSYLFLILYLFSFSSCFIEDIVLVDKKIEFYAYGGLNQVSLINQKGFFKDSLIITRQDIINIISDDIKGDAEFVDLNIHDMTGLIIEEDHNSNQTNSIDMVLKFNDSDVFISNDFNIIVNDNTGSTTTEASPKDFFPSRGIRDADHYLEDLLTGKNDSPLILELLVSPHNPSLSDPFTSLELDWRIGIIVKYKICTTVPVGTQAEDCNKIN